ncbi:hypothetical protein D9611_012925 [Ephemerocybe angulata]|uniref:Uncharacterized protein n=1 Tax=Ephemerocybe angulata TaxID=980116 RepID=A0A8H5C3Z5_9AGAR|nr:hypothetical protein D9611_012925 [Tulosesus angulatus]
MHGSVYSNIHDARIDDSLRETQGRKHSLDGMLALLDRFPTTQHGSLVCRERQRAIEAPFLAECAKNETPLQRFLNTEPQKGRNEAVMLVA